MKVSMKQEKKSEATQNLDGKRRDGKVQNNRCCPKSVNMPKCCFSLREQLFCTLVAWSGKQNSGLTRNCHGVFRVAPSLNHNIGPQHLINLI